MYKHLDQVLIEPPTFVYQKMIGTKYGELWDREKFNENVELDQSSVQEIFCSPAGLTNGRVSAVVVRKLIDDRYLVTLLVTVRGTNKFSDANYLIVSEEDTLPHPSNHRE